MQGFVRDDEFDSGRVIVNGNKYMIGNGYMGYRGTLDEFTKTELQACTLAGLYDQAGDQWREPVNAPNGLYTVLEWGGEKLTAQESQIESHSCELDIGKALFRRETVFKAKNGNRVTVGSERFASADNLHLLAMKYSFTCSNSMTITLRTGIDGDVWDINGPHLDAYDYMEADGVIGLITKTLELGQPLTVAEALLWTDGLPREESIIRSRNGIMREYQLECEANRRYTFVKYVSIYTGLDRVEDPAFSAARSSAEAATLSYEILKAKHEAIWQLNWERADVIIDGDDEAQLALRYSLYQLLIIAPTESEKVSIPARGLSGQVYKGAVFWDTEMFMLPFFLYTRPDIARNLVMYRVHTLDGARRKAAEYGYRGAFYAWESQDLGDDACTLFNITDVFTNRPMRTYFRDKQIHISADAAHGIWQYYLFTNDEMVLWEGGAEVVLECARFFCSYAYFNREKNRYEMLDVTGPDEYHERVHNNAFTNAMAHRSLDIALQTVDRLRASDNGRCEALLAKLGYEEELSVVAEIRDRLYLPEPDAAHGIIEQFDGYRKLEDVPLAELKGRMLNKNEYLGGGNGLATTTQIIKQADVVLMLHLFRERYDRNVKRANWAFYEPRTEHGSSLSPCVYALVAADIGDPEWAYPYFKRTATVDLTGDSKQYVGTLYIGGTHPAANGGAWMAAVLGFAGLNYREGLLELAPSLPAAWKSIKLKVELLGNRLQLEITHEQITVASDSANYAPQPLMIGRTVTECAPGASIAVRYNTELQGREA